MLARASKCYNGFSNLLQLLLLRALACIGRLLGGSCLRTILSIATGSTLSAVALASYYSLGKALTTRIHAIALSTAGELRPHRRRFSQLNIAELPAPVQRYFAYALREGQTYVRFVCLKQTGLFRTAPVPGETGWKKVSAEQYFSTTEPGFVWAARVELAPLVHIRGWDSYINGRGNLYWKLCSLVTVEDTCGRDVDRSALVRYLSECPCFPTALLPGRYVSWEPIDNFSARCHLRDHGCHVSGVFHFAPDGRITHMETRDKVRLLAGGLRSSRDVWTGSYSDYKAVGGMRVPTRLEASWTLPSGEVCPYSRLTVTECRSWDSVEGGLAAKAAAMQSPVACPNAALPLKVAAG